MADISALIEQAIGERPSGMTRLSGGCVGDVYRFTAGDDDLVAKVDLDRGAALEIEGYMLRYLGEHCSLPVPEVVFSSDNLLIMEFIPGSTGLTAKAEEHAAELFAELHEVRAESFGLERDTLIGGLHQPNKHCDSWLDFYREQRVIYMAEQAVDAGNMASSLVGRLKKFAGDLDKWLDEPAHPSLVHGDAWGGNILSEGDRITGLIDPAVYYAHPEVELAFATLFGTFGKAFFARYTDIRGLADGFFEVRRDIYNIYPLLVHARLFGGGYAASVDRIISAHGY